MLNNTGILCYGSLISIPGPELEEITINVIKDILTPFRVEFSRLSPTRSGAPVLVPVENTGAQVQGVIFVLRDDISIGEASDRLYKREINAIGSNLKYDEGRSEMKVGILKNFSGLGNVIYAHFPTNINNMSPSLLAKAAIKSAKDEAGKKGRDGIQYLITIKKDGILTPLMKRYEQEILRILNVKSLELARNLVVIQNS